MNLPLSFKISIGPTGNPHARASIEAWLIRNTLISSVTFDWITNVITFENEEDAVAFAIRFGIKRFKTKIEQMIENANN